MNKTFWDLDMNFDPKANIMKLIEFKCNKI